MRRFTVLLTLLAFLALAASPPASLEERLDEAYKALKAEDYQRAVELFEDVVALDYQNFRAHFGLGLAYLGSGALKEALFEFKQVTTLFPDRFEGWYNLGVVLGKMGDWEGAAKALSKAVEVGRKAKLGPKELRPAYLLLAAAYRHLGQEDKVAEVMRQAYQLMPDDTEIALLYAQALAATGKGDLALPLLYQILAKEPANVEAAVLLAHILSEDGLYRRAARELDRALEKVEDPKGRARLLFEKAMVLSKAGAPAEEVAALLEEATALDPGLWQAHYKAGRIKLALGDAKGALRSFMLAYRENPEDPRVILGLAAAYDALGAKSDAYRMAKLALDKLEGPERVDALWILAKNAFALGRYEEARDALKEVVKARPSDAEAWLWLGMTLYQLEDYGQAANALERAAELDNSREVLSNLGAAYLAARRFGDAERVYRQLVEKYPNDAEAWYNLGWALKALGRDAEAKRAWERARELGYRPELGQG